MKIAFLEDDAAFAATTLDWLQQAGHQVAHFSNGRDCIRAMADTHFDLCLLDWELPDLSGPEVMASLKLKGIVPPVIFLTGRDAEEDVIRMLEAGADDFIVKPPSRGILLARIQAAGRCCKTPRQPEQMQSIGEIKVDF
ncbi:MAG: response regulator transcription factor, partial [Methylophilaceae bacterium]